MQKSAAYQRFATTFQNLGGNAILPRGLLVLETSDYKFHFFHNERAVQFLMDRQLLQAGL